MWEFFEKKMEIDIAFDHREQTESITNKMIRSTVEPKWSHLLRP